MPARVDITNQRFGKLLVIRQVPGSKGIIKWECTCDCGNKTIVSTSNLQAGNKRSCGCLRMSDIAGQRFGKLVAVRPVEEKSGSFIKWQCNCDCGNSVIVSGNDLRSGHTKSCGCASIKDLTGQRFGKLTVINHTNERSNRSVMWVCQCDCGNMASVSSKNLSTGTTQSCGCLYEQTRHNHGKTHGLSYTPEYKVWTAMLQRCYNPKNPGYADYGGRGIFVEDERWFKFINFYADMGPRPSLIHSIDRIDNNKGYCLKNCRWTTDDVQAQNKRPWGSSTVTLNETPIILDEE
jgi:hypothetical protein